ncbi:uncharacterized protein LOC135653053 [Musa acuminata AAA Group]|uniref:uncharacterized protein LOC135653053 n=1 Tax=Musa acuminata AAA Group TaxID=214697 RepID=UPI0031D6CAB5
MCCVGWLLNEEDMAETKTEREAESPMTSRGLSRCPRIMVEKSLRAAEAVEQARDDDNGVVRVKIVVTKRQLRQMVASMGQGPCNAAGPQAATAAASASNLELLLHVLRRRHMKRAETGKGKRHGGGRWRPALKSIPEDIIQD